MSERRSIVRRLSGAGIALLLAGSPPTIGEPPAERTAVVATADAESPRILVRWGSIEGDPRYAFFDVLRRDAPVAGFVRLNDDPIGALTDVASIEAIFNAAGRVDALTDIEQAFGTDYASDILKLQRADAADEAELQLRVLAEQNYAAALALGRGWLDETALDGGTYVYEVWGLDDEAFRVERLGRAVATSGAPAALPPPVEPACVDPSDAKANMTAFVRWSEPDTLQPYFGFDVYRAPRNPDLTCPPLGPTAPGSVKVNESPLLATSAGQSAEGLRLFDTHGLACHQQRRDAPPDPDPVISGVEGTNRKQFRRLQYAVIGDPRGTPHDTPDLNGLTPEALEAIYDYVLEFQLRDDGSTTPGAPLTAGETYCYQVAARDLLGKPGMPAPPVECPVEDRIAPRIPAEVKTERLPLSSTLETCRISWRRNEGDTARYKVLRAHTVDSPTLPRFSKDYSQAPVVVTLPHLVDGGRETFDDALSVTDAGQTFFYAVVAEDDAGSAAGASDSNDNRSGFSAWVPCTPRDLVAPGKAGVDPICPTTCGEGFCEDKSEDDNWKNVCGGDPEFFIATPSCPVQMIVSPNAGDPPGETARVRRYRSFRPPGPNGEGLLSGPDFDPGIVSDAFAPLLDAKIHSTVRPYDESGNFGPHSDTVSFVVLGKYEPPPPRLTSVQVLDAATGEVAIRFRSLEPTALIGFALYAKEIERNKQLPDPADKGTLQSAFPPENLAQPCPPPANQWAVKAGAQTLDQVLPAQKPATGPYLFYEGNRIYEMVANLPENDDVRLHVAAIGWSGREGPGDPFLIAGFARGDDRLDWPEHARDNPPIHPCNESLTVETFPAGGPPYTRIRWTSCPSCAHGPADPPPDHPFAVFRRRAGALAWQQISPLFKCFDTQFGENELVFIDTDVEEGFYYDYVVIGLTDDGEFDFRYGPSGQVCFGACSPPVPE
jgi:hypothetical protein